jgi:hypothetical protein
MFLKKWIKCLVPHGLYEMHRSRKIKKKESEKISYSQIEAVVLSDEATKNIGKDWVSSNYYDLAEKYLDGFWEENTVFYKHFTQLDCTNIVELACGHGRHVQKYLKKASVITLIDLNQENIDFCKQRYANETKIKYLVNNGRNFDGIDSNSQTAVFTYDPKSRVICTQNNIIPGNCCAES